MSTIRITSVSDLSRFAQDLVKEPGTAEGTTVLALHGELGAGKTTFVQCLGDILGIKEQINSPTFVVMKAYETANQNFKTLIHIDAYRIEDTDEMRVLHFDEILKTPQALVCIEWAEKIEELIPEGALHIHISIEGENRKIVYGRG